MIRPQVSQRRACEVISVDRSSARYHSVRPDDAIVRVRLRELAAVRRRFSYFSSSSDFNRRASDTSRPP